ncbi:MAG: DUF5696 domain-containing protein [Phycisphaerae bacterium]
MAAVTVEKSGSVWVIRSGFAEARYDARAGDLSILDKRCGVLWRTVGDEGRDLTLKGGGGLSVASAAKVAVRKVAGGKTGLAGIEATYSGFKGASGATLTVKVLVDGATSDVVVEVMARGAKVEDVFLPRRLTVPRESSAYVVVPEQEGAIIPGDWRGEFLAPVGWADAKLPFFGAVQGGAGLMAVVETDDDFYLPIVHPLGGPPSVGVRWIPSKGQMRYPRRLRYRLFEKASYVTMALAYREIALAQGLVAPLEEKAKSRPEIAVLRDTGAMVSALICMHRVANFTHTVVNFDDTLRRVRELAARYDFGKLIVHTDGWGVRGYDNLHPDVLPPCPEAGGAAGLRRLSDGVRADGHLFCLHDNYRDIYFDAPSFDVDLLITDASGKHERVNMWAGGLNGHLCSGTAYELLTRNVLHGHRRQWEKWPGIKELINPGAMYIDNYCLTYECWHKDHPATRGSTKAGVRRLYDFLQSQGIAGCCEHVTYWGLPKIDIAYMLRHLRTTWLGPDRAPEGSFVGVPVPLWSLVFRDCVAQHMHTAEWSGGRDGLLRSALAGVMPNIILAQFDTDAGKKTCEDMKFLADFRRATAFDRMTGHELLTADGSRQRATFSSGAEATIDLATGEAAVTAKGETKKKVFDKAQDL